jgi:hypothetical protein
MPLGNGDLTVLAWANTTTGGLQFYISKMDAMASATSLLHLGFIQLTFSPSPFLQSSYFNQTHCLETSSIEIYAGGYTYQTHQLKIRIFVDVNSNSIFVDAQSRLPEDLFEMTVKLESLRPDAPFHEWTYPVYVCPKESAFPNLIGPDVIIEEVPPYFKQQNTLILYHRNNASLEGDYVQATLKQQGLSSILPTVNNQWLNRTFGIAVDGMCANFSSLLGGEPLYRSKHGYLKSPMAASSFTGNIVSLSICVLCILLICL